MSELSKCYENLDENVTDLALLRVQKKRKLEFGRPREQSVAKIDPLRRPDGTSASREHRVPQRLVDLSELEQISSGNVTAHLRPTKSRINEDENERARQMTSRIHLGKQLERESKQKLQVVFLFDVRRFSVDVQAII